MPFNLDKFKTAINYGGVLKGSRYEVIIKVPTYLQGKWGRFSDTLMYRCEAARLPGLQFASADGPARLGYGPIERTPYNVNYEEISLTFIMDAKTMVHNFFYDWCNSIFNFNGGGGMNAATAGVYEVGYKNNYATDIDIAVYKDTGKPALKAKLFKAFPMALPAVPMNWNDSDVVKLTIPFTYLDFQIEYEGQQTGGSAKIEPATPPPETPIELPARADTGIRYG